MGNKEIGWGKERHRLWVGGRREWGLLVQAYLPVLSVHLETKRELTLTFLLCTISPMLYSNPLPSSYMLSSATARLPFLKAPTQSCHRESHNMKASSSPLISARQRGWSWLCLRLPQIPACSPLPRKKSIYNIINHIYYRWHTGTPATPFQHFPVLLAIMTQLWLYLSFNKLTEMFIQILCRTSFQNLWKLFKNAPQC